MKHLIILLISGQYSNAITEMMPLRLWLCFGGKMKRKRFFSNDLKSPPLTCEEWMAWGGCGMHDEADQGFIS